MLGAASAWALCFIIIGATADLQGNWNRRDEDLAVPSFPKNRLRRTAESDASAKATFSSRAFHDGPIVDDDELNPIDGPVVDDDENIPDNPIDNPIDSPIVDDDENIPDFPDVPDFSDIPIVSDVPRDVNWQFPDVDYDIDIDINVDVPWDLPSGCGIRDLQACAPDIDLRDINIQLPDLGSIGWERLMELADESVDDIDRYIDYDGSTDIWWLEPLIDFLRAKAKDALDSDFVRDVDYEIPSYDIPDAEGFLRAIMHDADNSIPAFSLPDDFPDSDCAASLILLVASVFELIFTFVNPAIGDVGVSVGEYVSKKLVLEHSGDLVFAFATLIRAWAQVDNIITVIFDAFLELFKSTSKFIIGETGGAMSDEGKVRLVAAVLMEIFVGVATAGNYFYIKYAAVAAEVAFIVNDLLFSIDGMEAKCDYYLREIPDTRVEYPTGDEYLVP